MHIAARLRDVTSALVGPWSVYSWNKLANMCWLMSSMTASYMVLSIYVIVLSIYVIVLSMDGLYYLRAPYCNVLSMYGTVLSKCGDVFIVSVCTIVLYYPFMVLHCPHLVLD